MYKCICSINYISSKTKDFENFCILCRFWGKNVVLVVLFFYTLSCLWLNLSLTLTYTIYFIHYVAKTMWTPAPLDMQLLVISFQIPEHECAAVTASSSGFRLSAAFILTRLAVAVPLHPKDVGWGCGQVRPDFVKKQSLTKSTHNWAVQRALALLLYIFSVSNMCPNSILQTKYIQYLLYTNCRSMLFTVSVQKQTQHTYILYKQKCCWSPLNQLHLLNFTVNPTSQRLYIYFCSP